MMPLAYTNMVLGVDKSDDQQLRTITYTYDNRHETDQQTLGLSYLWINHFTSMNAQMQFTSLDNPVELYVTDYGYKHRFNANHALYFNANFGYMNLSDDRAERIAGGGYVRLYNRWQGWQLFNELFIRGQFGETDEPISYDYSVGIRYRATRDLSLGFKGENVFDNSR